MADYISAWKPDNIINGHFDIPYLIWRLQATGSSVLAAWFPLALCFAGSCYVAMLKRHFPAAFLIIATACALLTCNFIMLFYVRNDVQPFGLLQSFFLLVLLLPWLANFLRPDLCLEIRPFQLFIVIACTLLATVGSDGFPERPMVLSSIPLLFAFADPRLYRLLAIYTGISAVSVLSMSFCIQRYGLDDATVDLSCYPHLEGLKAAPQLADIVALHKIDSILASDAPDGQRYAFAGTKRYIYDYVFNDTTSYSLHHFRYVDKEEEMAILQKLSEAYDGIFLMPYRTENSEAFLLANGFRLVESTPEFKFYRRSSGLDTL